MGFRAILDDDQAAFLTSDTARTCYDAEVDARQRDYPALASGDVHYVDFAGSALYAQSQLDAVHADLSSGLHTNPHRCARDLVVSVACVAGPGAPVATGQTLR